jgi:hypothetical protein
MQRLTEQTTPMAKRRQTARSLARQQKALLAVQTSGSVLTMVSATIPPTTCSADTAARTSRGKPKAVLRICAHPVSTLISLDDIC